MPAAIIGGTGLYRLPDIATQEEIVETPYGEARIFRGQGPDSDLLFLTRHGVDHSTPPHQINYRANIKALEMLGVKRIIANYAVGSINPDLSPMSVTTLGDFLDFTKERKGTFFDGGESGVAHVEMSQPYSQTINQKLRELGPTFDLDLHADAVYVCTHGPRFESPTEIKMYRLMGGDVVGMTGIPELTLARELGMCFAALALSINWAAGIRPQIEIVEEGLNAIRANMLKLCIAALRETVDDDCRPATLL